MSQWIRGAIATLMVVGFATQINAQTEHFDPKGKPPSEHTLAVRAANAASLPFADERDLEEAARGFIAAPPYGQIMADAGHVAWDMARYQFLREGEDFGSIRSLSRRRTPLQSRM